MKPLGSSDVAHVAGLELLDGPEKTRGPSGGRHRGAALAGRRARPNTCRDLAKVQPLRSSETPAARAAGGFDLVGSGLLRTINRTCWSRNSFPAAFLGGAGEFRLHFGAVTNAISTTPRSRSRARMSSFRMSSRTGVAMPSASSA